MWGEAHPREVGPQRRKNFFGHPTDISAVWPIVRPNSAR